MPTKVKHYIIIGTSGAASKPRQHNTLTEANKEAERLAAKHPGESFSVYESKTDYKLSSPVTKTIHV